MPENEYRQFEGEIRLLESKNPFLFPVELWLLNDAPNRNGWRFTDMEGNKNQFAGTPILIAYTNGGRTIGDGHNGKETIDPATGEPRMSFTAADAERIIGAISEDDADIRTEVRDDKTWIVAKGFLWAWYAREAVQKIENDSRQGRGMSVSIEALVTESHMEGNVEVEDSYKILGTAILGDHVQPAVAGAHISMLSAIGDEFKELKLRAASYREQNEKPHHKNKGVRKQMYLSKQQLKELQKRFGTSYVVLAAKQDGEDVKVLLMRRSDHVFATYTLGAKDAAVDEGRVAECAAQIVATLAEDETLCADAAECMAEETCAAEEQACAAEKECKRLSAELEASNARIAAMETAESKRRVSAAKEAAKRALSDFNAARLEAVSDSILESVNRDIDSGVYANSVNADNDWIGETAVAEKVYALCAKEQMKLDQEAAKRRNSTFIMDKLDNGRVTDDGSVSSLLARKGIQ